MNRIGRSLLVGASLALILLQAAGPPSSRAAERAVAFVGVGLVPMDRERVQPDRTVIVRGDRIVAVGRSDEIEIPDGATVIDGQGKFLMPGLTDMHVHTWSAGDLTAFVANGVTTVRNMFGSPMHLRWRKQIARGRLFGPTIYTAGPIVDGKPAIWPGSAQVTSVEQARVTVREQAEQGYDFVKVYNRLPRAAYEALVAEAAEVGIPVMGHVPDDVGLARALASGQTTIEHLSGYSQQLRLPTSPGVAADDWASRFRDWSFIDPQRVPGVVDRSRQVGVWNCVTLTVMKQRLTPDQIEAELKRPYIRYVPPMILARWRGMLGGAEMSEAMQSGHAARTQLTRQLNAGGARILLGTDMGNPFVPAGFSIHWELRYLTEAGLTPYEALRAGTRNAAAALGAEDEFGTIRSGRRADLLLLDANPLRDVANVKQIGGVMLRGRWLDRADLDARMEALAARNGAH